MLVGGLERCWLLAKGRKRVGPCEAGLPGSKKLWFDMSRAQRRERDRGTCPLLWAFVQIKARSHLILRRCICETVRSHIQRSETCFRVNIENFAAKPPHLGKALDDARMSLTLPEQTPIRGSSTAKRSEALFTRSGKIVLCTEQDVLPGRRQSDPATAHSPVPVPVLHCHGDRCSDAVEVLAILSARLLTADLDLLASTE